MRNFRPIRVASAACLAWSVASIAGCGPSEASFGRQSTVLLEEDDDGGWGEGAGARGAEPLDDRPRALLAAFDDEARMVLVDPRSDEIVATRSVGAEVGSMPTDLVFDPFARRLVAVVMPPPFEASEILAASVDGDGLGAPHGLGWATGEARVMPMPDGVVVASHGDGPRVRLLRDDGARTLGRSLPEPLSWWLDPDAERIAGLGADPGGALVTFALQVDGEGSISVRDRVELGLVSEDARLVRGRTVTTARDVRVEPDDLVVHSDETGEIARVDLDGGSPTVLMHRARALEGAGRWGDALVVTTRHPDALVVRTAGEEATIDVPEGIPPATPFGRHDLAVIDDRLFVATGAGIVAFVRTGRDDLVARDATFHGKRLRGPMVVVAP